MAYYKCGGKVSPNYVSFYSYDFNNLDISWLDTSNITRMHSMFAYCSVMSSLNLSIFDTSNVTNMANMFQGCSNLSSLNVSSFDTSNVTRMNLMFYGCSKLTSLDLSSFTIASTPQLYNMFGGCSSLNFLDISGMEFGTYSPAVDGMFDDVPTSCTILVKDADAQSWLSSRFPNYTFTIKS